MRVAALCAGYGGLEMGLAQVLDVELAWYCEYEPPSTKHPKPANAAARVMAHRFPGVPNHGDLTTLDWASVEPVDLLVFGWPCQPFSAAGKRKGAEDERAIWPDIARGIGLLRPRYLFAENVPNVVVRGELARVLTSLAGLGFDAVWTCLRASSVGAPHRRERFFLTAAANTEDFGSERGRGARQWRSGSPDRHCPPANTSSDGRGEGRTEPAGFVGGSDAPIRSDAATDTDSVAVREQPVGISGICGEAEPGSDQQASADTDGTGREGPKPAGGSDLPTWGVDADWDGYAPAIRRWEQVLGRRAPAPTVLGRRGGRQLNPVFVEFLMGLPEGWVTAVPGLTRNQMLKCLGNGCVPAQAAAAFRHLWPLLTEQAVAA